ncbi:MAG: sigma-70 family RNA polymerase sigma factor [Betaproteobacteria bacterium]|nr:sigma-70 family RNA polymerase sigma factor [Betaproteobacteria bacterium]
MPNDATRDPRHAEIESHRGYLVRYALAKLRDRELSEEVVQEALLAALEALPGFRGDASLRTWLTSILRFKIADAQRERVREREVFAATSDEPGGDLESLLDAAFGPNGEWREPPAAWADPHASLEQQRFWEVFERCLDRLPATGGRVFFQREVLGEETKRICETENITEANCWVIVHRARMSLRTCLEANWFAGETADGR